jgi:sulfide dehydrogenase cytochrome subunit
MKAFRSGERKATVMNRIARGYSDPQLEAMAAYFSAQRGKR